MVSQLKVNEIIKQSGSSITIGEDGDTLSGPFTNTPIAIGHQSSDQDLTKNSYNKVVNWTIRKYLINWQLKFDGDSSGNTGYDLNRMSVFKNGSEVLQTDHVREPQIIYGAFVQFGTLDLVASDYLEFYFYPDRGGGTAGDTVGEVEKTYFTILRLIGV